MLLTSLPVPPAAEPVNTTGQAIMTVGTFAGLAVFLVCAFRLGRRWRTPTPAAIVAGTLLAGMVEPLNNRLANMWYYRPGQQTMYSSFDASLPVWVFFSYAAFFGGVGLLFWYLTERGATRATIAKALGGMWVFAIATEITGTQLDTYDYFGPHPFRVAGFPIWVSLGVACICASIGIGAARIRRSFDPAAGLAAVFLLGPVACVVGLVGTGFPTMTVVNTPDPSTAALYGAALGSTALNLLFAWFLTQLVPREGLPPIDGPVLTGARGGDRGEELLASGGHRGAVPGQ
ncbi:hypothetical protein [Sporichthya polymorpha]|uniref:hypothetical protein n=1 Tax=Sporichthya polymorpha TaxID=35751 RepID=UPI00039EFB76|nr:hypothetical protein [Sporichthya polymorpha]